MEWCNEEIYELKRKAQDKDALKIVLLSVDWTPTGDEPKEHWMDEWSYRLGILFHKLGLPFDNF